MKKNIVLNICIVALASLLFVACKKDKTTPEVKPDQEEVVVTENVSEQAKLLLGQWKLVSRKETSVVDGKTVKSKSYTGQDQDFVEFTEDKITISFQGDLESLEYKLLPDNKILIDGKPAAIETLTSNECVVSTKTGDNVTYDRVVLKLAK